MKLPLILALLASGLASQDPLFTHRGLQAGDQAGFGVDGIGDVNADGHADYIVGTPFDDTAAKDAGKAVVYSGIDGSVLFTILGDAKEDQLGWSVSGAGDVDMDGTPDFILGAPLDDTGAVNAGSARVHSGKDGKLIWRFDGELRWIFGISVAGAGDVDKDGHADVIVGGHGAFTTGGNAGTAVVYSGKTGLQLYKFDGDGAFDFFGHTVGGVGDLDGDGHADVAVGAPDDDNNGKTESGMARVYSGKTGAVLFTWDGDAKDDFFGHHVASAGDVDNDGTLDVIVGATQFFQTQGPGYARVFSGKTGNVLYTFRGDKVADYFGEPCRGVGDLNGDGHADIVCGAQRADANGVDSGLIRVFSGKDGSQMFELPGREPGALFGLFVSGAGDVNDDGTPDLIAGAPLEAGKGVATVLSGKPLALFTDTHTVSAEDGGEQKLNIRAGSDYANMLYIMLGSMRETATGIRIPPSNIVFPLDFDAYMSFTLAQPGSLILGALAILDQDGKGTARFVLKKGQGNAFRRAFLRHAYMVIDLNKLEVVFASNAAPLRLVR